MVNTKQGLLIVMVIVAIHPAQSNSQDPLSSEFCKQNIYERLISQNRITTALALKYSDSIPVECTILIREQARKTAIEQADYFTSKNVDKSYRGDLKEVEDKSKFRDYDFQISGNIRVADPSTRDQRKNPIEQVRGYISISGQK